MKSTSPDPPAGPNVPCVLVPATRSACVSLALGDEHLGGWFPLADREGARRILAQYAQCDLVSTSAQVFGDPRGDRVQITPRHHGVDKPIGHCRDLFLTETNAAQVG